MKSFSLQSKILIMLGIVTAAVFALFAWNAFGGGTTLGVTLGGANSGTSLADGLVGHWTFDGKDIEDNILDRSGNGNNGSLNGFGATSTALASGVLGQGITLNGDQPAGASETSPQYVEIPESSTLRPTTQWSVSGWVKPDVIPQTANGAGIFDYGLNDKISVQVINRGVRVNAGGSWSAIAKDFSEVGAGAGEWIHVVAKYDNTTGSGNLELYFNGQLVGSVSSVAEPVSHTQTGWIGRRHGHHQHTLKGDLDDVRIYNRALSADEIQRLYQLGATTKLNKTLDGNTKDGGPVAHWTFDGKDVVDNVADVSGNGNTAFLQNFSATNTALTIGKIGGAASTEGSTNYKITTDVDIGSEWTATAWFKYPLTTTGSSWWTLLRGSIDHQILINRGTNLLGVYDNSGGTGFNSSGFDTSTLADGWHHIATIGEGTTQDFYIDGSLVGTASFKSTSDITTIGNCPCDNQNWGVFDDVRIYNRALSTDEIQRLYQLGATTKLNKTLDGNTKDSGPIGHWTFDGKDVVDNVADISGNANHGKMKNFTATNTALTRGRLGQGMTFDGVDDHVEVVDPPGGELDFGSAIDFSLIAWFKTNDAATQVIFGKGGKNNSNPGYSIRIDDQGIDVLYGDGTSRIICSGLGADYTDDAWHILNIVFNRSSSIANVFVDGIDSGEQCDYSSVTGSIDTNDNLLIGALQAGTQHFNGHLDDLRIYDRALSAEEVKRLYNLGR